MKRLLHELKRRHVHRAAFLYLAGGWLLLQVADVLAEIYDLEGTSLQWLVALLVGGFLPVLALAWIFEWTPEGLRRDSTGAGEAALPEARSRRGDRALIALLALATAVLLVDRFLIHPAGGDAERHAQAAAERELPTIAVLPFLDLSPEGGQAHMAIGIADEMLGLLARVDGLRVAARTSSFSFRDRNVPIPEIAAVLGVRYVLEGSVNALGERLRIRVQLVDAVSGFQLWSESYDSQGSALFDVQEQVARQVAEALQLTILGPRPRVYRTEPAAHNLVLEAEYLDAQGSPDSMRRALEKYRQAIDIDGAYPPAWTGLSAVFSNLAEHGSMDWDDGHRQAKQAAQTALELDPGSSAALQQLAWIARTYEANLLDAARYMERALSLTPADPDLIGHAAVLLQSLGRLDDAIRLHEHSVALDPVDTRGIFNLALAYYFAGRLDESARQLDRVLVLAPRYTGARYRLGTIRLFQGAFAAALAEFEQEGDDEYRTKGRALALHALGRHEEADAALAELTRRWGARWPSEVAQVHAYRGELDQAFEWLEKDFQVAGAAGWGEWRLMRLYRNLHDDPRWSAFLERVGVAPAQLEAIPLRLPPETAPAVAAQW